MKRFSLILLLNFIALPGFCDSHLALETALQTESRDAADRARDAGRKPAAVLEFLGIESGMIALDVIAAGGYYTEVLSLAVGSKGKVYAQNPESVLKFRDGANDKAMTKRLADNRLANVVRWDRETADLGLETNSVDIAITALNFHDIYNGFGEEAATGISRSILTVLKPGGVLGVIDHRGVSTADNTALHRIELGLVLETLLAAGFSIESTSELLHNTDDDHTKMVFSPDIRGKTDRFLIKAVKPH